MWAFNWGVFWAIIAALALGETGRELLGFWNIMGGKPRDEIEAALHPVCDKLDVVNDTLKEIKSDLSELTSSVVTWTQMNP